MRHKGMQTGALKALVALSAVLLGLIPVLALLSWKDIKAHWDLRVFLSEYLKTLGYVLPVVIGFMLLNLYWERHVEAERNRNVKLVFLEYTSQLCTLLEKVEQMFERRVKSELEADRREEEVRNCLEQAVWLSQALRTLHTMALGEVRDHELVDALTRFCFSILPRIEELRNEPEIRPGNSELRTRLLVLAKEIREWNQSVRGGPHESGPSRRPAG